MAHCQNAAELKFCGECGTSLVPTPPDLYANLSAGGHVTSDDPHYSVGDELDATLDRARNAIQWVFANSELWAFLLESDGMQWLRTVVDNSFSPLFFRASAGRRAVTTKSHRLEGQA